MDFVSVIKKKWILISILLFGTLIALSLFSRKSVETEIFIPSNVEQIWAVLMDEAGYKHWNPVLLPIEGEISEGATIKYQWTQPGGEVTEIKSKVVKLVQHNELHQRGGTPGILTFDHRYNLKQKENGTLVMQSEVYKGIGVLFWDASQMKPAYQRVNEALKMRVRAIGN